jgi:ABC-type lipoprotein export system ATPase subunit
MAQTKDVDMVLVMGLSGAGKSYFINALTGAQTGSEDEAKVGKKLKSCKKRKAPQSTCRLTHWQVLQSVKQSQRPLGTQISL